MNPSPCHECGDDSPTVGVTPFGTREERCGSCEAFSYWQPDGFRWNVSSRCVRLMRGAGNDAAQRGEVDIVPAVPR